MIDTELKLDFGKVYIKENILIAELDEGILFDVENNRELLELGRKAFNDQPYGYISHRINSYAVNPMVYKESANTPNLHAIGVVTYNSMCTQSAVLEKQFYKNTNPFEIFSSLDVAIEWIKGEI
jgi:hypothetical protein